MKYSSWVTFAIYVVTAVLLGEAATFAAHACCQSTQSYPGCFGCVQVSEDPAKYLQVGVNTVNECVTAPEPMNCDESPTNCYVLIHAPVYLEENCSTAAGTMSFTKAVGQCDGSDHVCGSAG